jgi:nucleoside-diphosphate-sugar epimerase
LVLRLQPNYVVHLAALAFVAQQDVESFYRVNLFGALNLLDALIAAQCPVRKVVVSSSANVYGNVRHSPVAEDTCPAPVNHYAMSKLAMEHMALTRLDKLPIVISRPFNYTGVGQSENFLIPKIVGYVRWKRTRMD